MDTVLSWIAGIMAVVVPGFAAPTAPTWSGYVEAEYVYIGASGPGQVTDLAVGAGELVREGDLLFVLTSEQQQAQVMAAEARVAAARANLANLTTGSRKEEVEVIRANLSRAEADLRLATDTLKRSEALFADGLITQARLEQDRAQLQRAQAGVDQLEAQLKVAELPARDAQQQAAEATLVAAEADATRARADLADRAVEAPIEAEVDRVFFSVGEIVGAGVPVISLLPSGALKVKFYVPEPERHGLQVGATVSVSCDGCPPDLLGTISYFDSQPQNTPPIIYSREERHRLVFLVEAQLPAEAAVLPGQPVTVEPLS